MVAGDAGGRGIKRAKIMYHDEGENTAMTGTPPPLLYVTAVAPDAVLVERLSSRLSARGLQVVVGGELGEPRSIDARVHIIAQADLVLVVASRAALRSSVVAADYDCALARGRHLIPLIVETLHQ